MVRIGIDVGSTTAKLVVIGSAGEMLFSRYTWKSHATLTLLAKQDLAPLATI